MASKEKIIDYDSSFGFGLPQDIRRGNPLPLDHSSVQLSLEDAEEYAKNDPTAYVGQIISVYIDDEVKAFIIADTDGNLIEVGSGSGATYISKEDYESLPEEEKTDKLFLVYDSTLDSGEIYYNGVLYGVGNLDSILQGYVTDEEMESHIENTMHITQTERINWNGKADNSDFIEHVSDMDIHITATERTKWDNLIEGNPALKGLTENNGDLYFNDNLIAVMDENESQIIESDFINNLFKDVKW